MRFFKLLHIPPFLIKKTPKIGIQGNNLHIFLWHLQDQKIFSKKPPTIHFEMPKKMTPKSQAKIKPPFSQYPFFIYFFTLKKYHVNKYTILSLNAFMRLYSNVYNYCK